LFQFFGIAKLSAGIRKQGLQILHKRGRKREIPAVRMFEKRLLLFENHAFTTLKTLFYSG